MARLAALALTALLALTVSAFAQAPTPAACGGGVTPDDTGDANSSTPGAGAAGQKAPENFDITQGFFRTVGKDVMANFQVVKLDKTKEAGWDAVGYWAFYKIGDTERFVASVSDGGEWSFYYGTQGSDGFIIEGETKGKAHEGPNGVMEIVMPGALNKTLTGARFMSTSMLLAKGDPVFGSQPILRQQVDVATGGDDYVAKPCSTDPVGGGGGGGGATTLALKAPSLKASKLKKGKKFSVSLTASGGEVKNISATLAKGRKTLAKGKLASLAGSGKLSLKVSGKVKKGSYKLVVKGTDAAGKAVSSTASVRVK